LPLLRSRTARAASCSSALSRFVDQFDFGIEQIQQQAIAVAGVVAIGGTQRVFQQCYTAETEFGGQCGGLANVVRLQRTGSDQRVGALRQGVCGEVFELAQLVAAHGQRRQVIALDVHLAAEPGGQPFEFFQRRRVIEQVEAGKAVQLLFDHESVLAEKDERTIGTRFCRSNRQSLIAKSTDPSTIGS
jgi:hypothetical protein